MKTPDHTRTEPLDLKQGPLRVLLIEDDPIDQRAFTRMVREQQLPYEAVIVSTVGEAKAALTAHQFDVILTDYNLPDGTGPDAVIDQSAAVPIIVVTGNGDELTAVEALRAGAADYLIKDVQGHYLHLLPITVTRVISHHRVQAALKQAYTEMEHRVQERTTQLLEANQALHDTQERFRALYDDSPIIFVTVNEEGSIRSINRYGAAYLGYTVEGLLGRPVCDLFVDEDRVRALRNLSQAFRAPTQVHQWELRKIKRDGSTLWVRETVRIVREPSGETVAVIVCQDITERKEAEDLWRRTQYAVDHADDQIFLIGPNGYFQDVNESGCQRLGYTKAELLTMSVMDIDPDFGIHVWGHFWEEFRRIKLIRLETRHRSKSGEIYPVEVVANYHVHNGQELDYAIVRDITARKQAEQELRESEERFRQLVEEAPLGIVVLDANRHVVKVNRAFCALMRSTEEDLLGRPHALFPPQDEANPTHGLPDALLQGEQSVYRIEQPYQQPDGTVTWVTVNATRLTLPGKPEPQMIAIIEDITERKETESALAASQEQVRQMHKMDALGQLAGGIAHDFNNLLTAILGNAEIAILKSDPSHVANAHLKSIIEASQRASEVVQQILTFTRRQEVSRTVQALGPLVTDSLTLMRATLPAGVELTSSLDPFSPEVLANASQVHQLVMNLCTNAWHALGGKPGTITLTLAPITLGETLHSPLGPLPPGRYTRLSVSDTGHGMSPETVTRIFEPFFTTKPTGQGTGLGLSVVHGIVKSHGGTILVESKLDQGTTIHIYFPAQEPAPVTEPAADTRASTATATPALAFRQPCHLLYLDDEQMLVELVQALFEPYGVQVDGFTSPTEALQVITEQPESFDIIVTDYNMPEKSGVDISREVARIRPSLPVILVSGFLTAEDQAMALAAGIKEVVYKPTMLQELGPVVRRVLDNSASA